MLVASRNRRVGIAITEEAKAQINLPHWKAVPPTAAQEPSNDAVITAEQGWETLSEPLVSKTDAGDSEVNVI